jgi:Animal haem peroxidase
LAAVSTDVASVGAHSCVLRPNLKGALSQEATDKYGRMFPGLPPPTAGEDALIALGRSGAVMDDASGADDATSTGDNHSIPAGWTFFGQFIAHDITADRSLIQHHANVDELHNFRTPRLDLESVYAAGPTGTPYMYDIGDPDNFLLGTNDAGQKNDLPRNSQGCALVGDPRDDVHSIISQLHVAFLKFHNQVVDYLRDHGTPDADVFAAAQQVVRWHYQWIVIHEFLPLTVGQAQVDDILAHGPRFYRWAERPFIPIEFSDAAYRYGHSQIRAIYQLNDHTQGRVFPDCAGACPVSQNRAIDWRYFFRLDEAHPPQPTRRIDARLVHPLITLPESVVGQTEIPAHHSLAVRDLLRGYALDLPSGEAVAAAMGVPPLTEDERGLRELDWEGETPLWYYVLKESEVRAGGEQLGEVAGRIVAEVLIGLIDADPRSYRSADTEWKPSLPGARAGTFTMTDLLRFAEAEGRE